MDTIRVGAIRSIRHGIIHGVIMFADGICGKVIIRDEVTPTARLRTMAKGMIGLTESQYEDILMTINDVGWSFEGIIEYDESSFVNTFHFMLKEIKESV